MHRILEILELDDLLKSLLNCPSNWVYGRFCDGLIPPLSDANLAELMLRTRLGTGRTRSRPEV